MDDSIRVNTSPDGISADGRHKVVQKFQNNYRGGRHNQPLHFGEVITTYGDPLTRSSSQTSTSSSITEVELPKSASDQDIIDFLEVHYFNSKIDKIFREVTRLKQQKERKAEAERQRDGLPAYSRD